MHSMNDGGRVIHEQGSFRIMEYVDHGADLDNLKGDTFNPSVNPDIPADQLAEEERHFEDLVARAGVYGYVLERWDARVGGGWVHVDSCWGFVGQYTPGSVQFDHYIVDELKTKIRPSVGVRA